MITSLAPADLRYWLLLGWHRDMDVNSIDKNSRNDHYNLSQIELINIISS